MANPSDNVFEKVLERFRNSLTDRQRQDFSAANFDAVQAEIQNIQQRYGREKKLRNMKRLSKFLEAMKQIEELVRIFLNVHETVAFVWGPIKFLLMLVGTRLESLERLLDVYVEIGEVIPSLRQYEQLFRNFPLAREVLERYLDDIFQFHRHALDVFARPALGKIFASAWKTFDTKFKPLIDSLKRHRAMLEDEKSTAILTEIQHVDRTMSTRFTEQSAAHIALSNQLEDHMQQLSRQLYASEEASMARRSAEEVRKLREQRPFIAEKLGAPDYETDQLRASGHRFASSGDWILNDSAFLAWLNGRNIDDAILYLHGIPGSGKTMLMSRIIEFLKSQSTTAARPLLFYFFKHHDPTKQTMSGMLSAILTQLLFQDDSLIEHFYQKCCSLSPAEFRSLPVLKELARESLTTQENCLIVLDGLDEYEDANAAHESPMRIIDWFQQNIIPDAQSEGGSIRLLLAGQRDGVLDQRLTEWPKIKLDDVDAHYRDIRAFADSKANEIQARFSLDPEEQAGISEKVTEASDGMFLYARVVLENLLAQGSEADLEDELNAEKFPAGLQAAYERVTVRILERSSRSKREAAIKILGWIICAARPLRWREIQSRFCIDAEQGQCNFKNRRVDNCKVLCGSLVDADRHGGDMASESETTISLVHDTAGKYLVETGRIGLLEEHTKMALFCSRYLVSPPFSRGLVPRDIRDAAKSGYYGFQDYATEFWHHHAEYVARLDIDTFAEEVVKVLPDLFKHYKIDPSLKANRLSQHTMTTEEVKRVISAIPNSSLEELEERASAVRKIIEKINAENLRGREQTCFLLLNGSPRFKCSKIRCQMFSLGFPDRESRDVHVAEHERLFKCPNDGCYARTNGFSNQSALEGHITRAHPNTADSRQLFPRSMAKETDIFTACKQGDLAAIESLIEEGVDVNSTDHRPWEPPPIPPLILAARYGHIQVCRYLIQRGAKVYDVPPRGVQAMTPIREAIKRKEYDLFRTLVDGAGEKGKSRFMKKTCGGIQDCIAWAIQNECSSILTHLISWELSSYDNAAAFFSEMSRGRWRNEYYTRHLLSQIKPKDLNQRFNGGVDPLRKVMLRATPTVLKIWLEADVDVEARDETGMTPLCYAADRKDDKAVQLLLDTGRVNVDSRDNTGRTPLSHAAVGDKILFVTRMYKTVRLLLDAGADVESRDDIGRTPFSYAAGNANYQAARLLLLTGHVEINSKDHSGLTPFRHAIARGVWSQVLELMLRTDEIDLNSKDDAGRTDFSHIFGSWWSGRDVQKMLDTGRIDDVDSRDETGRTPLSYAAESSYDLAIQPLPDTGSVEIDSRDDMGRTPLSYAAATRWSWAIKPLLEAGSIDVDSRDNTGRTPLSYAA